MKRETWKAILVCLALCATITQLAAIFLYKPSPSIIRSDTPLPESYSSGDPTNTNRTAAGTEAIKPRDEKSTDEKSTDEKSTVTSGDATRSNAESPKPQASDTGVLNERELKELIQLASVEIFHPSTGTKGSGVVVDMGIESTPGAETDIPERSPPALPREGFEVVTACHVVKGKKDLIVVGLRRFGLELERTEYRSITVKSCDEEADLARVFVETPDAPAKSVRLAQAKGQINNGMEGLPTSEFGLSAWSLNWTDSGLPVPQLSKILERRMAQREPGRRPVGYWVIDGHSVPGMSGGPLLDQRGLLIGIASGNSGGAAYYLNEVELSRFLREDLSEKRETP